MPKSWDAEIHEFNTLACQQTVPWPYLHERNPHSGFIPARALQWGGQRAASLGVPTCPKLRYFGLKYICRAHPRAHPRALCARGAIRERFLARVRRPCACVASCPARRGSVRSEPQTSTDSRVLAQRGRETLMPRLPQDYLRALPRLSARRGERTRFPRHRQDALRALRPSPLSLHTAYV